MRRRPRAAHGGEGRPHPGPHGEAPVTPERGEGGGVPGLKGRHRCYEGFG